MTSRESAVRRRALGPLTRRMLLGGLLGSPWLAVPAAVPQAARTVRVDALTFPVRVWGEGPAPPMLLLHGFPQEPLTWEPVAGRLVQAGWQVFAPALRGYAAGNRFAPYTISQLVRDCLDIADALGLAQFDVAGFGIGGALAWVLAAFHPDRVLSIASIRYPHPAAMAYACQTDAEARRKWEALQAQLGAGDPAGQAEALLAHHEAALRRLLQGAGLPPPFLSRYVERMREREALAAALAWNSAVTLEEFSLVPAVQAPALLIWSEGPAVSRAAVEATRGCVENWLLDVQIPDGGHFLLETAPDSVAYPLVSWLGALTDEERWEA